MEPITEIKPTKKVNKKTIALVASGAIIVFIIIVGVALALSQSVSFNNLLTPSSYSAQDSNSIDSYTIANPPVSFAQYAETTNPIMLKTGEYLVLYDSQLYALDINTTIARKMDITAGKKITSFALSHDKHWLVYVVDHSNSVTNSIAGEPFLYNLDTKENKSIKESSTKDQENHEYYQLAGFSNLDKYITFTNRIYSMQEQKFLYFASVYTNYYNGKFIWNEDDTALFIDMYDAIYVDPSFVVYKVSNSGLTAVELTKFRTTLEKHFGLVMTDAHYYYYGILGFKGNDLLVTIEDRTSKLVNSYPVSLDKMTSILCLYDYQANKFIEIKKDLDPDNRTRRNISINSNLFYDLDHDHFLLYQLTTDLKVNHITTSTMMNDLLTLITNDTSVQTSSIKTFPTMPNILEYQNKLINLDSSRIADFTTSGRDDAVGVRYGFHKFDHLAGNKFLATYYKIGPNHFNVVSYGLMLPDYKVVIIDIGSGEAKDVKFQ